MGHEPLTPHWYNTVFEAQHSADWIAGALGHRLEAWIPQPYLLKVRSLTTCAVCTRGIEVHPYWDAGCFIGFVLIGAALSEGCPHVTWGEGAAHVPVE